MANQSIRCSTCQIYKDLSLQRKDDGCRYATIIQSEDVKGATCRAGTHKLRTPAVVGKHSVQCGRWKLLTDSGTDEEHLAIHRTKGFKN